MGVISESWEMLFVKLQFSEFLGSISPPFFCLALSYMSYHGPRDNGEGRPGDIDTDHRETHVASSGATTTPSRSIPTPLRMAWDLDNPDQEDEPEVTTSSDSPSILTLLRRPRSRSPPPREHIHTASQPTTNRPLLFTPGLFGLQPEVETASMNMESAIVAALQVAPPHLVRTHILQILAHHIDRSTISERFASFAARRHDPIDDA